MVVTNEPDNAAALQQMADSYIAMARVDEDLNPYHQAAYFNAARKARAAAGRKP